MLMARDGMSQADLARLLEVKQQQVSQRLAGKARFTFAEIVGLAEHFGVNVSDFGPGSQFLHPTVTGVRQLAPGLLTSTKEQLRRSAYVRPTFNVDLKVA